MIRVIYRYFSTLGSVTFSKCDRSNVDPVHSGFGTIVHRKRQVMIHFAAPLRMILTILCGTASLWRPPSVLTLSFSMMLHVTLTRRFLTQRTQTRLVLCCHLYLVRVRFALRGHNASPTLPLDIVCGKIPLRAILKPTCSAKWVLIEQ